MSECCVSIEGNCNAVMHRLGDTSEKKEWETCCH